MISICPITKAVHFDHFIKVAGFASLLHSKIIPFVINKYSVGRGGTLILAPRSHSGALVGHPSWLLGSQVAKN